MPSSDYDVNINIKARDQSSPALKKTAKNASLLESVFKGVGQALGGFALQAAKQIPQVAKELVNLGMQSEAASLRFERFAGGSERAAMFLDAFNEGAQGTVDRMAAMTSGSKLLQMGLVGTGDEMSQIVAMATRLGDQTQDAGDRIGDFAALLANQSIPRLDNFGISSGRVRARIEELLDSGAALNREEAFKMAVMEEGSKALEVLGDTTETASYKMGILKSALTDAKVGVGELAVEALEATGDVGAFAEGIRAIPEILRNTIGMFGKSRAQINAWAMQNQESGEIAQYARFQVKEEVDGIERLSYVSNEVKASLKGQVESQGMLMHRVLAASSALEQEVEVMDDFVGGMDAAQQMMLSMQFTRQLESMAESAANFAQQREEIESEHQVKIAELQKRGQATAIQINEAAEQKKLQSLQRNLEIALLEEQAFTEKTKETTRMRKEDQIAQLQGQIAQQTGLLDAYHSGTLIKAGENVDALIAEENRRKEAAIASLDEQMAKQQALQDQQMGQMLLQTFDQWSENKNISVEKMLEMRTAIAEEYGLVSEGSTALVNDIVGEWDRWATETGPTTDEIVGYLGGIVDEQGKIKSDLLELTAQEWVIKVRYEESGLPPRAPSGGGGGGSEDGRFQHGGQIMVGEAGPEIITVQPLGGSTFNDTFNIYDGRAMATINETRRRQRRGAMMRIT